MENVPKKLGHKGVGIWHDGGHVHEWTQRDGRSGIVERKRVR